MDKFNLNLSQPEIIAVLILATALYVAAHFKRWKRWLTIQRWQKALNVKQHQKVFNHLFKQVNGFKLSRQARLKKDAMEYLYGEIEFAPFIALLSLAKPDKDTVFYDLGSGTGKAVLACAMVFPVKKSVGIELFEELHQSACNQKTKLSALSEYQAQSSRIHFTQGDFLATPMDDATVIFINATALIGPTWINLCQKLSTLPYLQIVITTSKPLNHDHFTLILTTQIQMSWGIVSAYIHQRQTNLH